MERKPIPVLSSHHWQENEIIFAYPYTDKKIIRICRDEPLYLEIEIVDCGEDVTVAVYADFPNAEKKTTWKSLPMEKISDGRYSLTYAFNKCGLFEFKIKYSKDNGETWFWDSRPSKKVFVDPPSMKSLRVYTFIPTVSGTISDWKKKLVEIKELGFNAIHLLPITKMGGSESPYSATDLFDIDHSYLAPNDPGDGLTQFESFVEEAKKNGIRLFVDIVVNHINPESNVAIKCPDWIVKDSNEADGFKRAGATHNDSWIRWNDLVLINYKHDDPGIKNEIWNYFYNYVNFWATYAYYTGGGLRFDNLHSSNPDFITYIAEHLKEEYPDLILMGEYFSSKEEFYKNVPEWQLNLILGNSWEYKAAPMIRKYIMDIHAQAGLEYFLPLTTHDTGSPAQEYGCCCSTPPRYLIYALMGTGQTGIVQGTETGIEKKIEFIGRNGASPAPGKKDYRDFLIKVNELHAKEVIFHEFGNIQFVDNGHNSILAAIRSDIAGKNAWLLIANLDIHNGATVKLNQKNFKLPFTRFKIINIITGRELRVTDMVFDFFIEACETRIFQIEEC
ncbi:MAG: alpha-amylase family glycosyl hydrolase [Spirochaetes bacterium]|nr:alpha-amylase family glycosyl hydrolase [Spirochaetota bacterium]